MEWIKNALSPTGGLRSGRLAELGLGGAASMSGGETREDGRVSFGFSLMRGKRPNMEDFHHAEVICRDEPHRIHASWMYGMGLTITVFGTQFKRELKSGETIGLFGVFDGW